MTLLFDQPSSLVWIGRFVTGRVLFARLWTFGRQSQEDQDGDHVNPILLDEGLLDWFLLRSTVFFDGDGRPQRWTACMHVCERTQKGKGGKNEKENEKENEEREFNAPLSKNTAVRTRLTSLQPVES